MLPDLGNYGGWSIHLTSTKVEGDVILASPRLGELAEANAISFWASRGGIHIGDIKASVEFLVQPEGSSERITH
jgi:hypothetical protein